MELDKVAVCYLFDLIAVSPAEQPEMVAVLAALLQEEAVQKVVHDGGRDAEALLYQLNISIRNVLDTQVRTTSISRTFKMPAASKCSHYRRMTAGAMVSHFASDQMSS